MKKTIVLLMCLIPVILMGCSGKTEAASSGGNTKTTERPTYYYVASGQGQPFTQDMHLGFKWAAAQFNVEIVCQGADDWNAAPTAEALEQLVPRRPAGIITAAWDPVMNPGIIKAQQAGIPIVLVEAHSGEPGDVYIGLDNVDTGRETAETLIKYAGNSGKLLVIGNWGSTNIDDKFIGLKERLQGTGWQIMGDLDGECEAEASLTAAKSLMTQYPDATAFVGLDSACGAAIATAMKELGKAPGALTVICADREDPMLEFIKEGYISASLTNRTAMMCYLAVAFVDMANRYGFNDNPITANNKASGISAFPKQVFTGNVEINKNNVDNYDHNKMNMNKYNTPLFK
jgi:ABC-type sugar transport system substrate-binding protein